MSAIPVFATKLGMTQAWTAQGKRLAITRCKLESLMVVGRQPDLPQTAIIEVGFGKKKLNNNSKPLRTRLERSGFSLGAKYLRGIRVPLERAESLAAGSTLTGAEDLQVGDVVKVQGITRGRGFGGVIKRHGFHGGPKTHGQSDRWRAPGAIGCRTTPGRVILGKRMAGHYGVDTCTVTGLTVVHLDPDTQEVWLSGPIPGTAATPIRILKTGQTRTVELNKSASGLPEIVTEETAEVAS